MKDWIIVDDIKNAVLPNTEQNKKFYVVICKGGKTKIAFPDKTGSYPMWNTLNGYANSIWPEEVVAYKELEIPDEIIALVLSNDKSKNSHFAKFYK